MGEHSLHIARHWVRAAYAESTLCVDVRDCLLVLQWVAENKGDAQDLADAISAIVAASALNHAQP
jgi:hypothetical protein